MLGQEDIYGDGIGSVELWDSSMANISHETRAEVVAKISTLSYGNADSKYPMNLYKRLIKMGHLSTLEFVRGGDYADDGYGLGSSLRNSSFEPWNENVQSEDINLHRQAIFENVCTFKIKCPLFIRSQFQRHRAFSYLELSRRYTKPAKVKFEFFRESEEVAEFNLKCEEQYQTRLKNKEAPELARGSIPMDAYTEFWVSCNVDGLANFLNLRKDPHAQEPIRVLAQSMHSLLEKHQTEFSKKTEKRCEVMKEEYKEFADELLSQLPQ